MVFVVGEGFPYSPAFICDWCQVQHVGKGRGAEREGRWAAWRSYPESGGMGSRVKSLRHQAPNVTVVSLAYEEEPHASLRSLLRPSLRNSRSHLCLFLWPHGLHFRGS